MSHLLRGKKLFKDFSTKFRKKKNIKTKENVLKISHFKENSYNIKYLKAFKDYFQIC